MNNLNVNDKIASGGQYTFKFQSDGKLKPDASDVRYLLATSHLPISDVNVSYQGGVGGLFGSTAAVSFLWTDTGWTVKQVAENMEAAMSSGTIGHFTFVQAQGGTEVTDTQSNNLSLNKILVAIVILIVAAGFALGLGRGVGESA